MTLTITCCGQVFEGDDALTKAVEHKQKAHPETVGKKWPSIAARAAAARAAGSKAAARRDEE